jgi:hypothetical protein
VPKLTPSSCLLALSGWLAAPSVLAAEAAGPQPDAIPGAADVVLDLGPSTTSTPIAPTARYLHVFGSAAIGRGLRFNNPYRLSTVLGDDAESLSLSATYADFGLGALLGEPRGLQHGAALHLSVATDGITQEVASLSYQALHPLGSRWFVGGRGGVPVILEPDLNAGLELAGTGAFMLGGGLGLGAELAFSLFYGAATLEHSASVIPLLSFQLGVWLDYEVLP